MRFVLLLSALGCAACGEVPKLDDHVTPAARQAPYPALLPLGPLLEDSDTSQAQTSTDTDAALQARAAALRARARRMQQASGQE